MNAKPLILKTLIFLGVFVIFLSACDQKKGEKVTVIPNYDDIALNENVSSCNCESTWFPHSQTPAPEEGKNSPFDSPTTTNCLFQQWSWQKFLWLTKPSTNTNSKPLFLDSMLQVSSTMIPVSQQSGASLVLTDIKQAGPDGVLKTNPAFNQSSNVTDSVYYAIYVNNTMRDTAVAYGESLINGKLPPKNTASFPVGSLELKTSWVAATSIPSNELGNYYTTTAAIQQSGNEFKQIEVALLGMHVVGVVINHPEFIWATFEHSGMAPLFDWDTKTVSGGNTLLYANATASDINGIRWDSSNSDPDTPDQAFTLYEYGVPRTSDTTYMATSQQEPENYNNIKSLNNCVSDNLDDVWKNYFQNGALWINTDGLTKQQQVDTLVSLAGSLSVSTPGAITKGSVNEANLTMETYTQTFQHTADDINVANLVNCFTCHNAQSATDTISPLYISHAFDGYMSSLQGKSDTEINDRKLDLFIKQLSEEK